MASGAVVADLAEFEQAVRANARSLFGLALSILSDEQEAEDAVQDTMEIAWRRWHSVRDEERRGAWLRRICLRRCLRVKRRLFAAERLSDQQRDLHPWQSSDPVH